MNKENIIKEIILFLQNKCGVSSQYLSEFNHISMTSRCCIVLSKNKRIIKDGRVFFDGRNVVVTHIDIVILMLKISHNWKLLDFNINEKEKDNE